MICDEWHVNGLSERKPNKTIYGTSSTTICYLDIGVIWIKNCQQAECGHYQPLSRRAIRALCLRAITTAVLDDTAINRAEANEKIIKMKCGTY